MTTEAKKDRKMNQLQPLLFLEGVWNGEGMGPYGSYESETRVESRGRWILMTYEIFQPDTSEITYFSTQVYGYDDEGLTLDLYDTAGAFKFHAVPTEKGVRFEWKDGEEWKRSEYWLEGENIHFKYDSMEADHSDKPSSFEGIWQAGKR